VRAANGSFTCDLQERRCDADSALADSFWY